MATDDDGPLTTDEKLRRGVGRTVANTLTVLVSLGLVLGWASTGIYTLEPGEAAVILQFGAYHRTKTTPGLAWHWPEPIDFHDVVNIAEIRREQFGLGGDARAAPGEETATFETAMQTADSNIVNLSYVVQYTVDDAFLFVYRMADPLATLRDAAQASVRQIVGQTDIDGVLSEKRSEIQNRSRELLQRTLDCYFNRSLDGCPELETAAAAALPQYPGRSPFRISQVQLQVVQPPVAVQDAFDDVTASQQDEARAVSLALGDEKEILARAEAQATEIRERALADKAVAIAAARGAAGRFDALRSEYQAAPEVTRRRLYLETLESVLPDAEKIIVEPGSANLVPLLPLQNRAGGGTP
ncbi:MAG: protease modulator HflK [Proteobacteria bacterium]|nr:protease modulator HflK [Pseudomonadota bacterium]